MGCDGSRVIEVDQVEEQLNQCRLIKEEISSVYGNVHYVDYNGMEFYLGESLTKAAPHPMSLHYLVPPNLLVISKFTLLQQINPASLDALLQIISGIAEMAVNGGDIGIGYGRIAYAGRWGVVGEQPVNWAYHQLFEQPENCEGVFLSPQLMMSLSQGKSIPKHSAEKSDVFALGIILVEMIFQEKLGFMFDYQNFEISLKPLLEKLYMIRQQYGDQVYEIFLGMLEIDQQERFSFVELYEMVEEIRRSRPKMINSKMNSSTHSQRGSRTPTRQNNQSGRSPVRDQNPYGNNVSPFRARPMQSKRGNQPTGRTPESNRNRQQSSRSPLKRDLKINPQFGRESNNYGYNQNITRRPLSPISRR